MAKNMWGKQPPKKQAYTPPELGTPNFWGPAPVPPKVYQVWDEIRGEGRDGNETEDPEGLEESDAHDSWVSKFSKRFAIDPVTIAGEGRDGSSTETEGKDETSLKVGLSPWSLRFELALSGNRTGRDGGSQASGREQGAGESDAASPTVRGQGAGAHDSWVSKFSQQIAIDPVTIAGEGKDGNFTASPVKKPKTNPMSSILGAGRDGKETKAKKGLDGKPKHDSWVNAFEKKLVNGKGSSWRAPVPASPAIPSGTVNSGPVQKAEVPADKFVGQWNFRVKVDGIPDDNCKLLSISGLSSETEPIEFKRSTNHYVEAIPGKYKYSNVELTKVMNLGGDSFAKWREEIEGGANALRTITVYLHHIDLKGDPVMVLTLHDAWPIKWEFPELNGSSSDAAVEKITLNVGRITRG